MKRSSAAFSLLPLTLLLCAKGAYGEELPEDEAPVEIKVNGVYSIWGLNQRGFLLGQDHPLDDASYVVQNFRLGLAVGKAHVGGKMRLDAAQGWWGVDNAPDVIQAVSLSDDGALTSTSAYNPYALFEDKGTHYDIHVDQAFIYFDIPELPVRVEVGRQYRSVGNKLVLDHDHDGLNVVVTPVDALRINALWLKISEGNGSYRAPVGALMSDDPERSFDDADLFGGTIDYVGDGISAQVFGLHYHQPNADWGYLPQGLGYNYSRFQPQVSHATAVGAALDATFDVAGGLALKVEGDYLVGRDLIENSDYAGNNIDINDGTLRGYNALVSVDQKLEAGVPLNFGLLFGLGSGDDDPTGGPGNVNRIQTMGLFPLTNVWEDSVMPDLGGISPQGLGSPVSRGYRELENTTAVQVRAGVAPIQRARLDLSYTYLKATQPIHGWDASGPTSQTSPDIGMEVDANLTIKLWKELTYKALFGYFVPGEGAGLLINGSSSPLEPAWEVKQVLLFTF